MSEVNLADLPEAIPLKRVSPVWRVLAILAGVASILCLVGIVGLAVVVQTLRMQLAMSRANWAGTGPVFAPPITTATAVADDGDDEGRPVNVGNLPYPTEEDLRQASRRPAAPPENSARDRFIRQGQEVWKCPNKYYVNQVTVSPDGQNLAFLQGNNLVAGPMTNLRLVEEQNVVVPTWGQRPQPPARNEPGDRLVGVPVWSTDSRYVYFANAAGKIQRYDVRNNQREPMPIRGEWPTVVPNDAQVLLVVRSRASPKVDVPGSPAQADQHQIVRVDLKTKQVQVLVPAGPYIYQHPAVSPDGRKLAVWSHENQAKAFPRRFRLVLLDLQNRGGEPEKPVIAADSNPGPICWSADGTALIYERGLEAPLPPDCLGDDAPRFIYRTLGLFHWDLDKQVETRLSRGSGFSSPSVAADGGLFYLMARSDRFRNSMRLRRTTLTKARDFAAAQPERPLRSAEAWSALVDQVWQQAGVPADLAKTPMTPEQMARFAESFAKLYKERFQEESPSGPEGFDRQIREIDTLKLPRDTRRRLLLVLGAVRGEYLRTKHDAVWHLAQGPPKPRQADAEEPDSPFAYVVNIFQVVERASFRDDEDDDDDRRYLPPALEWALHNAEGRPLVLTNDAAAAQAALAKMTDADLARGTELLQQGKLDEGERVLTAMLERKVHQANYHLALLVGQRLYEHKRFPALQTLMERICEQDPADSRKFNLLGLAYLDQNPGQAINAFKKALRCDLRYGPGYFNLAEAYRQAGDTRSASACLRRYLELMPYGIFASDASQRLAVLEGK